MLRRPNRQQQQQFSNRMIDYSNPVNKKHIAKGKINVAIYGPNASSDDEKPEMFWVGRNKHCKSMAKEVHDMMDFSKDEIVKWSLDRDGKFPINIQDDRATFGKYVTADTHEISIYLHRRKTNRPRPPTKNPSLNSVSTRSLTDSERSSSSFQQRTRLASSSSSNKNLPPASVRGAQSTRTSSSDSSSTTLSSKANVKARLSKIEKLLGKVAVSAEQLESMVSLLATGEQNMCPRLVLFKKKPSKRVHQNSYEVYFYCERTLQLINPKKPMPLHLDKKWVKYVTALVGNTIRIASQSLLGFQLNIPISDSMELNMQTSGRNLRDALDELGGRRGSRSARHAQIQTDVAAELIARLDGPGYEMFAQEATKPENQKYWRPKMIPAFDGDSRLKRFIWVAK